MKHKTIAQLFKLTDKTSYRGKIVNIYDLVRGIDELLAFYTFDELDERSFNSVYDIVDKLFTVYGNCEYSESDCEKFSSDFITNKTPYWSSDIKLYNKHIRLLLKTGLITTRKNTKRDFAKLTIAKYR